jgi:uncharacterized integral membrane protein (TIGR00697 family)
MKHFKYLDLILALFVTVLLVSNIASAAKIVTLGPFTYDAGTLLFPLSYIFGDVLTEVYGYKISRRVIWIGFAMLALMSAIVVVVGVLPGETEWTKNVGQDAYDKIFSLTPRIVLGSLAGYWLGSFSNSFVMAKLKTITQGKWLWSRTISSTVIGEAVDTIVFCAIAFFGTMPMDILWAIVLSNYVFKVGVEVLFTPLTYVVINALKRSEGVDADDRATNLNPFRLQVEEG